MTGETRRRRVARAAAVASVCAVAALVIEGGLRYRNARRARAGGAITLRYERDDRLARALAPNEDYHGRIHINSRGLRGPEVEVAKRPGTVRILVMGASAAFDVCAFHDSTSWPVQLERALDAGAAGRDVEVINAAVPGQPMTDYVIRLESELRVLSPDVVLLYAGHGAVTRQDLPGHRPPESESVPAEGLHSWLLRHSVGYEKFSRRLALGARPEATVAPGAAAWDAALARATSRFSGDLTAFLRAVDATNARAVIVQLATVDAAASDSSVSPGDDATWERAFDAPAAISREGFRQFNRIQRTIAEREGATFVNTASFGITQTEMFCPDDPIHVNERGAALLARGLADVLSADSSLIRRD